MTKIKKITDPHAKIRLSETETFGAIVNKQYLEYVEYGFAYVMRLTHPKLGPDQVPYIYYGSKVFDKAHKWARYQSSSPHVMRLLAIGFFAEYEIIEYAHKSRLKHIEDKCITTQWLTPKLRDASLNYSMQSYKLSRYKWCLQNLNQLDRRF